jgi:hypothetical protein
MTVSCRILLRIEIISHKILKKIKTHILYSVTLFSENLSVYEIMYKNMVEMVKVKVKCTLVQALRLCTGSTAHRRSRGIALPFHEHGTRRE